jgi:hypothetical protein
MVGNDPRRKKLRKLIAREFSASLMNDTKWNKVLSHLQPLPIRFRAKFITEDEVSTWGRMVECHANYIELLTSCARGGPSLVLELEYLEIDAQEHLADVETLLNSLRLPHSRHGDFIRIVGHVRQSGR